MLTREGPARLDPWPMQYAAGARRARPGQVDVLEDAALGLGGGEPGAPQPVGVDGDQLARLDLADDARTDDVQRGGLARHDPAALEAAEHHRTDAVRVPGRVHR